MFFTCANIAPVIPSIIAHLEKRREERTAEAPSQGKPSPSSLHSSIECPRKRPRKN